MSSPLPRESYDPVQVLAERFRTAIAAAYPQAGPDADPLISPSRNPKFGDFQSNAAMPLGKALGIPPRQAAQQIVQHLDIADLAEPLTDASIAGPGFINITLRADTLASLLSRLDAPSLGIDPPARPQTIVVDLCGVNLAKQMHVGHIRAIIIGDTLARVLARLGHTIIRQNHVGDWGLPIAMVVAELMDRAAAGAIDLDRITLDDLDAIYREAQSQSEADRRGLEAARRWWSHPKAVAELEAQVAGADEAMARAKGTLVKLQSHDPAVYAVWRRIADVTMAACLAHCRRLNAIVTPEHSAGESSYAEELPDLVADLESRGIAQPSDGALVVRVEGIEEPCIIRKRDGGYLYATTDLAGIRRRVQEFGADRVIYCVDSRQSLHFQLVFGAAIRAGYATRPGAGAPSLLQHAAFGSILGEDGRPFKTRAGENVRLSDFIAEAVERAARAVDQKNPDLPERERAAIAEAVGIAAIRHADLASDRVKDYVFTFDRMLAFEGNTGPYLLYALVRIKSIFRKAAERLGEDAVRRAAAASPFVAGAPDEKTLALALLRYPAVVRAVGDTLEPHRLVQYLFDLAGAFNGFFTNCPVLQAPDEPTRSARLRLCALTDRVLTDGLRLLGIEPLARM